jgi:hypothetical protein
MKSEGAELEFGNPYFVTHAESPTHDGHTLYSTILVNRNESMNIN